MNDRFANSARELNPELIPVIDISPLRSGENPMIVAQALHAASQGLGFIYVKGHGIPQSSVDAARTAAYQFFRSSDSDKASVSVSAQHRGWLRPGGAKMQDDATVDLKESFIWGYENTGGQGQSTPEHPLRGTNQWPDCSPQLQGAAMDYFQRSHEVAYQLMRGFALGLNLPENFFLRSCVHPISRGSFVYYPPQRSDDATVQFGVGPHTDFGVLTVLCQDDVGGLQVQDVNGDWVKAPPMEGTLIVNVGDLLSRWTDGAYKSTPHRVINASGRERLSLVLAFDPDPETVIDARDVYGAVYQTAEEPTTCGDYLLWRFAKAFSYRNTTQGGR